MTENDIAIIEKFITNISAIDINQYLVALKDNESRNLFKKLQMLLIEIEDKTF